MNGRRLNMSQLAKEAGFGTRIWSEFGYWGGRLYYLVVAVGTMIILSASLLGQTSTLVATACLATYGVYLAARFFGARYWESLYYRPLTHFLRVQLLIIGLTLVIAALGEAGRHSYLWLLYTLILLIISRYLNTGILIAGILEVCLLLFILRWLVAPHQALATFLQTNPDLIVQWVWIILISFIIHYLLRNIDARDETIATMSRINFLTDWRQSRHELETRWEAVMETYLSNVGGQCGSVWLYDQHKSQIYPLTNLSYCLSTAACQLTDQLNASQSIAVDSDHPIAEVVRTGQPLYCRTKSRLETRLSTMPEAVRICALPANLQARILVPVIEKIQEVDYVLGVLCIDFDRTNTLREHLLAHYFEFLQEIAQRVMPILRFNRQVIEQQTLHHLGVQVSSSVHLTNVLEDSLDALTGALGFEFATISLVDEEARLIRCVAGRNIPQAWMDQACHPLNGNDIQADVVRRGQVEILWGWDERFDRRIYERFRHDQFIRAFVPIPRRWSNRDTTCQVQGVVEVGYNRHSRDRISPDQLATLTTFIEHVAASIEKARLFADMAQHRELLAQLHQVSYDIVEARQPDQVLERLGEALRSVLRADIVMIYRYNPTKQTIDPPQVFGEVWGWRRLQLPPLDRGVIAEILHTGQPHYSADAAEDPLLTHAQPSTVPKAKKRAERTFTMRQNIKSFAGVPMLVNGEAVGVLSINYRRRHAFGENEQHILGLAAQLAAVALRNAEFNALSAELAVTEERNRLARQLHDSISQYLPAIQLMSDTALRALPEQPDQTKHWIQRIQNAARQTMAEVRINLFETRVAATRSRNLRQALVESAKLAREYFNLEVDFSPEAIPEQLRIPIEAELLLVCREAITNAARHSGARRVTVDLSEKEGWVCLQIQDNGCGFDLSLLSTYGKRGLELMRQRVELMRGRFNIESQPGQGTLVEATIPV